MKIGEFFAKLGFEVDDEKLKGFEGNMKALPKRFAIVTAAAAGALLAIDKFTEGAVRSATALRNFNLQTGLSAQQLQQWQNAAQLANIGATADDVSGSIMALEQNIASIRLGGGNVAPFRFFGINPFGGSFSILEQLREKIKKTSESQRPMAINLMQQMGISPEMINVLLLTNDEFERFNGIIKKTPAQIKALNKLGFEIKILKMRFTQWKDTLVADLAPALIKLTKTLSRFFRGLGDVAKLVFDATEGFGKLAYNILDATGTLKAFAVVAGIVAASLFPITAILAGLFLLLEDIAVFRKGGKSVLGELVKHFQSITQSIAKGMMMVGDTIDKYIVKPLESVLGTLQDVVDLLPEEEGRIGRGSSIKTPELDKFFIDLFNTPQSRLAPQGVENGNIINNSTNIVVNSSADAEEVANLVIRKQQQTMNFAFADVNNGALG